MIPILQSFRAICMVVSMAFILLQQDFTIVDNKTIDELTVVSVEEYYSPVETPIDVLTELKIVKEEATKDDLYLSDEEINLIALVTMAEAEGECEEGKKLVIDTILNRVDSEYFPDNVNDVVYQTNQFSSVGNGRMDRCYVDDYICELVKSEARIRTNSDVIFFTAGKYSKYGTPMFQVGHHYFSSYE